MREPYPFTDWRAGIKPPLGWDIADAVDDGWTRDDVDTLLRECVCDELPPFDGEERKAWFMQRAAVIAANEPPSAPELIILEASRQGQPDTVQENIMNMVALAAGRPHVLDKSDPITSARILVAENFSRKGVRTLHHYRGLFYEWNGSWYRELDGDTITSRVWTFLERARVQKPDSADLLPFRPNKSSVANVIEALAAVTNLPAHLEAPTWLDGRAGPAPVELLPVENGLLHLPSGKLHLRSPLFFNLNASGVTFDQAAKASAWLNFLAQIWPDDAQAVATLQDIFGYLLSPDTSQQKLFLIVGPKRSGKGTLARVLTDLLGKSSVAAPTLAGLQTQFGLWPLIGKSVGIIGDARLSGRADQAVIAERLLSISGEDSITTDRKNLAHWTGRLGVRFLIMTNELPRLADASGALASRFVVLTMENSFYGREDHGLSARLLQELPGILNWARDGYLRLMKRGYFEQPASSSESIAELEALGSPISAFIKERCAIGPGRQTGVDTMFAAWKDWCDANGRKEAGTVQSFGRDLRAAVPGLGSVRSRTGDGRARMYTGIDLAVTYEKRRDAEDIPW